jgi:hypothetical protein
MPSKDSTPRILQQQPQRDSDPQQQQAGSNEFQPKPGAQQQQMGEGSYEGTRDYNRRTQEYLKKADVEADAQAAKPRSEQEARDLEQAEEEGRSHAKSKGER